MVSYKIDGKRAAVLLEFDTGTKVWKRALASNDRELKGVHDSRHEYAGVACLSVISNALEHRGNFNQEEMCEQYERIIEGRVTGFICADMDNMRQCLIVKNLEGTRQRVGRPQVYVGIHLDEHDEL